MDLLRGGWELGPSAQDVVCQQLSSDAEFAAAVKRHDVKSAAAVAAARLLKNPLEAQMLRQPSGYLALDAAFSPEAQPLMDSSLGHREASRSGAVKVGDWVLIRCSNKSSDHDIVGQEGTVIRVDGSGWVDVEIPKLGGRLIRLAQRFLSPGQQAGTGPSRARGMSSGVDDFGSARSLKRFYSDVNNSSGPSSSGGGHSRQHSHHEHHHYHHHHNHGHGHHHHHHHHHQHQHHMAAARVPAMHGRGVARYKEIIKAVRKEMLALEENIPWNCVSSAWKGIRPTWRKSLRNLGEVLSRSAPETVIPLLAASMLELSEALLTDKGPVSLFAKGGLWDTRLHELAEGGNNPLAVQQLWEEMSEAVRAWLAGQGLNRQAYTSIYRAFSALDAAAEKGGAYLNQVPVEPILGSSRERLTALRGLVENEKHHVMARMDAVVRGAPADVGGGASDPEMLSSCLGRLVSPALLNELHSVHNIRSEVDTDADDGPDATDLDTDTEL